MTQYKLKPNQPDFEMVDGPLAGRKFQAGQVYTEIPQTEKGRFETILASSGSPSESSMKSSGPDPEIPKSEIRNPKSKGEVTSDA